MDDPAPPGPLTLLRLATLTVFLVIAGAAVATTGTDRIGQLLERAGESRWGPVAFVVALTVAVVMVVPGTLGTITASLLFGPRFGFAWAMVGLTAGSSIAFWIARLLGADGVRRLLGRRMVRIERFVGGNDFLTVFVLRLMPIVPFNGLNYAAGLAPVRYRRYLPATVLGMAPGAALVAFATDELTGRGGLRVGPATIGLAITVVISIVAARRLAPGRA